MDSSSSHPVRLEMAQCTAKSSEIKEYCCSKPSSRIDTTVKLSQKWQFQTLLNADCRSLIYDELVWNHTIDITQRKDQCSITNLMEACLDLKAEIKAWLSKRSLSRLSNHGTEFGLFVPETTVFIYHTDNDSKNNRRFLSIIFSRRSPHTQSLHGVHFSTLDAWPFQTA